MESVTTDVVNGTTSICNTYSCIDSQEIDELTKEKEEELLYGPGEDGDEEDALSDDSLRLRLSDDDDVEPEAASVMADSQMNLTQDKNSQTFRNTAEKGQKISSDTENIATVDAPSSKKEEEQREPGNISMDDTVRQRTVNMSEGESLAPQVASKSPVPWPAYVSRWRYPASPSSRSFHSANRILRPRHNYFPYSERYRHDSYNYYNRYQGMAPRFNHGRKNYSSYSKEQYAERWETKNSLKYSPKQSNTNDPKDQRIVSKDTNASGKQMESDDSDSVQDVAFPVNERPEGTSVIDNTTVDHEPKKDADLPEATDKEMTGDINDDADNCLENRNEKSSDHKDLKNNGDTVESEVEPTISHEKVGDSIASSDNREAIESTTHNDSPFSANEDDVSKESSGLQTESTNRTTFTNCDFSEIDQSEKKYIVRDDIGSQSMQTEPSLNAQTNNLNTEGQSEDSYSDKDEVKRNDQEVQQKDINEKLNNEQTENEKIDNENVTAGRPTDEQQDTGHNVTYNNSVEKHDDLKPSVESVPITSEADEGKEDGDINKISKTDQESELVQELKRRKFEDDGSDSICETDKNEGPCKPDANASSIERVLFCTDDIKDVEASNSEPLLNVDNSKNDEELQDKNEKKVPKDLKSLIESLLPEENMGKDKKCDNQDIIILPQGNQSVQPQMTNMNLELINLLTETQGSTKMKGLPSLSVKTQGIREHSASKNEKILMSKSDLTDSEVKASEIGNTEKANTEVSVPQRRRRRTKKMILAAQQAAAEEDTQVRENGRQKRRTAKNAEEIIRKNLVDDSDVESSDSSEKFVIINHKVNQEARCLSPPSLKRHCPDSEITTVNGSVKKIKVAAEPVKDEVLKQSNTKQIKDLNYIHRFFQRDLKEKLPKLKQEELEELLIQKIVETITMRGEIGRLREQARISEKNQEATRARCQQLSKQIKDFEMVLNRNAADRRANNDKPTVPIKINRSVGLQVNLVTEQGMQNLRQLQQNTSLKPVNVTNGISPTTSEPQANSALSTKRGIKVRSPRRLEPTPVTQSPVMAPTQSPIQPTSIVSTVTPAALVINKPIESQHGITLCSQAPNNQQMMSNHQQQQQQTIVLNGKIPNQTSRQSTPVNVAKTKPNDLIDLTDEEEKSKSIVNAVPVTTTTIIEPQMTAPQKPPQPCFQRVIQAAIPGNVAISQPIRVVQPSSQPTPTALVNNMNAPRLAYVMQGTVGPTRQLLITSNSNQIRPVTSCNRPSFSTLYKTGISTIANGTVRVLTSPAGPNVQLNKHPAPLPDVANNGIHPAWKLPPPAPSLKISRRGPRSASEKTGTKTPTGSSARTVLQYGCAFWMFLRLDSEHGSGWIIRDNTVELVRPIVSEMCPRLTESP